MRFCNIPFLSFQIIGASSLFLLFLDRMLERMLCPELRFEKVQQARRVSLDALEALDPLAQGLDLPGDFGPVQPVLGQDLGISLVPDAVADLAELPVQGIIGAFFVRIPVAFLMSREVPVSMFHVGLATPCSMLLQVFGIIIFYIGYENIPLYLTMCAIKTLFGSAGAVTGAMFIADCAEYGHYVTGQRNQGVAFSVQTFTAKFTSAISTAIGMLLLGFSPRI